MEHGARSSLLPAPCSVRCHDVLTELRVRDLAVIADVTLPFQPGLNVLTGETGAGKSMVVDALALLLGERASGDVVRPGADKTIVEGAFEFASAVHRHLLPPFAALGIELEEGRLVLKREVLREGKSRAWVNGSPVTISVLSEIGGLLVDLHGQHETQSLLRADAQRDMLDAYADADVERVAVRDAHARFKELEQREAELTSRQDIERAKPKVGEDEALDIESKRLAHAEELGRLARDLEETVDSAGLTKAQKVLAGLLRLDPSLGKWQELLDAAFASSAELAQAARAYAAEIEADPERLTAVEQRRDLLFRLQQKHGPTIADVLAARDSAARELELLDTADLDLRNIAAEDVVFEVKLNEGLDPRPLARVASGGELSRLMLTLKVVLAAHDVVPTLEFDEVD